MNSKFFILFTVLGVLILIDAFFIFTTSRQNGSLAGRSPVNPVTQAQAYVLPISEPSYIPILNTNDESPAIDGISAIVYDSRSGRFLFNKDSNRQLPIASLTKLLSATVVLENFKLDDIVTVPQDAIRVDAEKQTLYLGEKISVRNLLALMLIESSNDAAYALAAYAKDQGIDLIGKMNEKAGDLGMLSSHFLDPAGLNDQAFSTAEDLVKLIKYTLQYDSLWLLMGQKNVVVRSSDGHIVHTVESTDKLLGVIPDIIGGKTGYTDGASGCMILVVSVPGKNDTLISVVLGSSQRFDDTEKLINWVKHAYSWD